ncbi:YwaF family protein [Marinicrinis sediminis]|uniref:TIGR02206 family membrane protein n=1 Tax=Marinicrinis sediminis TaxID=1652465 RepID=A0ABW5R5T2_9BACL
MWKNFITRPDWSDVYPFEMFTAQHLVPLLLLIGFILLLYGSRRQLQAPFPDKLVRFGLGGLLIGMETILYVWYIQTDYFTWSQSLPLQLCSLSYILTILILLFPNRRLYEFLYFAGIGGAIQAIVTPVAILSGFPHFTYFYFFIGHAAIVWVALYMTWVHHFRPTFGSIWRVLLYLNILLVAVVLPANLITGGNYFFIARKPAGDSLLNVLGDWPWYILSLEGVAILMFLLLYVPFLKIPPRRKG